MDESNHMIDNQSYLIVILRQTDLGSSEKLRPLSAFYGRYKNSGFVASNQTKNPLEESQPSLNDLIVKSISKLIEDPTDDWSTYLSSAVYTTNTSIQNLTKFTLFCLMYGQEAWFSLETEKVAETNSIEEAVDDISTADIDKYFQKSRSSSFPRQMET